jgi:hypothetical protein
LSHKQADLTYPQESIIGKDGQTDKIRTIASFQELIIHTLKNLLSKFASVFSEHLTEYIEKLCTVQKSGKSKGYQELCLLRKCKFICLIPKNPSVPHFQ